MNSKERMLSSLNKLIREDLYINELCNSIGIETDAVETLMEEIYDQFWFDTMTWGADILAADMNIAFDVELTQAEKNSIVSAKWKNNGKATIDLLQSIADSWKDGETEITFVNGTIVIKFNGEYGVPTDIDSLKSEISKAIPCHLLVSYLFSYLLIGEIDGILTLTEMELLTLDKFAG